MRIIGGTYQDIAFDIDDGFPIEDGDFVLTESKSVQGKIVNKCDEQHALFVLNSNKGTWRNAPLMGANVKNYLSVGVPTEDTKALEKQARMSIEYKGYFRCLKASFNDSGISVEAIRLKN